MTNKTEILRITELAIDISEISPDTPVHSCSNGASGVSVTVFKNLTEVDWQMNLYEWSHDECYPAKLRFLRHRLEQMLKDVRSKVEQKVAA